MIRALDRFIKWLVLELDRKEAWFLSGLAWGFPVGLFCGILWMLLFQ